ncbi:MAG: lysine biosynthesis protein LysW [Blastocatellia bacterium]|nr:lysine biosynthesis protein LysW [Blastocatellia bacterium]
MSSVNCTECGADAPCSINLVVGEIVPCPDCGVELEVLSIDPIEVALAPEVEEDWGE